MSCPRCGAATLPSQGFCTSCGAALVPAENPQSAAAAPPAETTPAPPQPPASMHPIPEGGFTIEDIVTWLKGEGYSAKVVPDGDGESHIVTNTQGSPCNIFPNDFKGGRYASFGLGTGFATNGKFDVSRINEWNSNNRWCRAYYDNVNDPWLVMDIDLWPGGTYESLRDQFGAWNNTLARFITKYSLK